MNADPEDASNSARGARGTHRPLLSRQEIVEAAARVLERDGYDGLTMRAIADELRVKAPALYWHVANKEQLQTLLYDHLMADLQFSPRGEDWREDFRSGAHRLRNHLMAKRDLCRLFPQDFLIGPVALAQLDQALGILRGIGLNDQETAYAFQIGISYVYNAASSQLAWESTHARRVELEAEAAAAASRLTDAPAGLYRNVAALADILTREEDFEARFEFGIECLIAGIERMAATQGGAPS
jgi:TetR/AcrR family tetracycline transcriptional repressor